LASFISGLGKFAIICLKVFVAIVIFGMIFFVLSLITAFLAIVTGIGTNIIAAGEFGTIANVISTFGTGLTLSALFAVLVPTMVIIYLLGSLILGSKPRGWVLLCAMIIWILVIIGLFTTAISTVNSMGVDEVERIMKRDYDEPRLDEPLDTLQYQRLLYDNNAQSID
ncbi:MAG: hypothetical protein II262_03075, partial [Alistipes sp.]|nr:hypothetical protein [Alistipes sp.]